MNTKNPLRRVFLWLNNNMSIINDFAQGLTRGAYIRDFKHASKIFTSDNYALAPKSSWLFHVAFDLNSSISRLPQNTEKLQLGFLVKSASLPKYTIDVKTMNAYNRPNYVQTKIKYDPVTITFHDDSSDVVRDFWYDYMSHYYRDSDYADNTYGQNTKYNAMSTFQPRWGYLPAKYDSGGSEKLLKFIKIYSLHQKRFTEYVLVNPTITSFGHGAHNNSSTNEFMENTMTVEYETVLYNYGSIKAGGEPSGFGVFDYDKQPSPLTPGGGGTTSLLGPGGLADSATGAYQQLSDGNFLGAGLIAAQTYTKFKGQNIGAMAGAELKNIGLSVLNGDSNALNRLALPKPQLTNGSNSLVQAGD